MAPQKSAPTEPSRPKQSRFLIALFLAKSKPSNLSTQEYISSLRTCVQEGRRPHGSTSSHSHVDTAEFWRNEFKRSEDAQMELRARIFELEKMLDVREQWGTATPAGDTSQKKRRRGANEVGRGPDIVARKSAGESRLQDNDGSFETLVNDMKSSSDHDGAFLQNFCILQQLMSQTKVEFRVLATVLGQISSDIRRIVSSVKPAQSHESTKNLGRNRTTRNQQHNTTQAQLSVDQELDTKLASIARVFPYLLKALDRANQTAQDRGLQGHVIYSYIKILRDLLAQVCVLAVSQERTKNPGPQRSADGRFVPNASRNPASPFPPSPPHKTGLKLSNLLLALTSALDTAIAADNAILEGFLFYLLTRVGAALKVFVFGSDCDDFRSPNPATEANAANFELDEKEAEAQAPYLVYLLDRLVPLAPLGSHPPSRVSSISLTPPPPPPTTTPAPRVAPQHSLTKLPSTALQSTLLHAVFCSRAEAVEFAEALPPPLPTDELLGVEYSQHMLGQEKAGGAVADWFKMEVWRIVGWNVLSGQIGR